MNAASMPDSQQHAFTNRRRAERRRQVRNIVREERERLNSPSGRPAFDRELCVAFARTRLSASYAIPLLVVIIGIAAALWADQVAVLAWATGVLAAHVAMLLLCRVYLNAPADASIERWNNRFALVEFIGGLAWATLLIVLPRTGGDVPGLEVLQFAAMLIMVSVVTSLASALPPVAAAGTLPLTLALVAVYISRGGVLFYALAAVAVAAQVFFLVLAWRLYSATLAMLESRAEKDVLIVELETAKAVSDESRRRAEEANLAKSRFLATMSHELRTPLNAILGFSEIMKGEVLGPVGTEAYKSYLVDIHTSGEHLLNLINEILDLSRIEAGRYALTEEPVNLAAIAAEGVRMVQLRAKEKNIAINERLTPGLPNLWADDRAVRQIVLNLLSNAIKFTQPGGQVTVKVGIAKGGGQLLSVSDNGPGIPPEEIPIVLSAFGQGAIAIKSAERGAGLGLPIVQALMHTHDGTFELKSKLREGTEAIAIFPQKRVMEPLPPIVDTRHRSWRQTG